MSNLGSQDNFLNLTQKEVSAKNTKYSNSKLSEESTNSNSTESFLNSLMASIEETNKFLPDRMKITEKEILNEFKAKFGTFSEMDKNSLFESASFMQILSIVDMLKANTSEIKLANLSTQMIDLIKTDSMLSNLKNANSLNDLLDMAKQMGLSVKDIKLDNLTADDKTINELLNLKTSFPTLDKQGFFKSNIDDVFKQIVNDKLAKINANLEKHIHNKNQKSDKNTTNLLNQTLQNLDAIKNKSEKKVEKKQGENDLKVVIKNELKNEPKKEIKSEVKNENEIKNEVKNEIKNENKNEIKENLKENLKENIKENSKENFKENLKNEVKNEVSLKNEVKNEPKNETKSEVNLKNESVKNEIKSETNLKSEIKENAKNEVKNEKNEVNIKSEANLKNESFKNEVSVKNENLKSESLKNESVKDEVKNTQTSLNVNLNESKAPKNSEIKESKSTFAEQLKMNLANLNKIEQGLMNQNQSQNSADFLNEEKFKLFDEKTSFENSANEEKSDNSELNSLVRDLSKINQNQARNVSTKETLNHFASDLKEAMNEYKAPVTRLNIILNPANLGEVEVTLVQRGHNLHINFNSNTNAMNLFLQNQAEFKNSLVNMGFTGLEMNFSDKREQSEQKQNKHNKFSNDESENSEEKPTLEVVLAKYF